ncbi:hypothetical protein HK413_13485 [Mucilaginibacter sp. S1162]|uniref:Uncharacterized protein n=1 Tax=Mucilaginibacter humi TaxID=2732510 RepID=A0ABX1W3K8_9SPHI|nr:hypothetical protein [Mucilaginibacter humi]NNU34812.1 hypothetical protein [Mucilaginibacter humi]
MKKLMMSEEIFKGFDDQLKDLRPEVKEKAIELAAGYHQDGTEAGIALKKRLRKLNSGF